MSTQAYTNRLRLLAIAGNTKVQQPRNIAVNNNSLYSTIGCTPNFKTISYILKRSCNAPCNPCQIPLVINGGNPSSVPTYFVNGGIPSSVATCNINGNPTCYSLSVMNGGNPSSVPTYSVNGGIPSSVATCNINQ